MCVFGICITILNMRINTITHLPFLMLMVCYVVVAELQLTCPEDIFCSCSSLAQDEQLCRCGSAEGVFSVMFSRRKGGVSSRPGHPDAPCMDYFPTLGEKWLTFKGKCR